MTQTVLDSIKSAFETQNLTDDNFDAFDLFSGLGLGDDITDLRRWAVGRGMKAAKFDNAYRCWRICQELERMPRTAKEFVQRYTKSRGVLARYNGRLDSPKRSATELDLDTGRLLADLRLYRSDNELEFNNGDIEDAVGSWIRDQKNTRRDEVWGMIFSETTPDAEKEWARFVGAIVDTDKTSERYAIAAFKALMWQVKRKMVGEPVYRHLMPVIFGGQGSGKSEAVRRLSRPMSDLVMAVNFRTITDTKNMELWSFPLVFCDEMDQASRADVDSIKNAITKEDNSDRGHSSHNMITVRNGATFIGCCNSTLGERINDTTGMRRFAPVASREAPNAGNVEAGLPVSDWETINSIDFPLLWQSVDHRGEHPMELDPEAMAEWQRLTDEERAQDSVETWLRQVQPGSVSLASDGKHKGADLYPAYKAFCEEMGYKPCAANMLGKKMRNYTRAAWYPFDPPRVVKGFTVHEFRSDHRERAALEPSLKERLKLIKGDVA